MVLYAADLLKTEGLGFISRTILSPIVLLDEYGAWTWNLRLVGVATAVSLWIVRLLFKKKYGIDWYALLHALVSGGGSLACVYLDLYASEAMTGTVEPLRSLQCQGALTSLHRILPAITMGYSLFDLLDGLTISVDFAMHGAATLTIMGYFCELGSPHIITPMLLMEVSTIFLTVVRADFFTPAMTAINQALFVLYFFLFRVVCVPYLWFILVTTMYKQKSDPAYIACFPKHFFPVCLTFGLFFHSLNAFWFTKIVKKARRKILGIEKVHANNDLKDEAGSKQTKKE